LLVFTRLIGSKRFNGPFCSGDAQNRSICKSKGKKSRWKKETRRLKGEKEEKEKRGMGGSKTELSLSRSSSFGFFLFSSFSSFDLLAYLCPEINCQP